MKARVNKTSTKCYSKKEKREVPNEDTQRGKTRINVHLLALIRGSGCVGGQRFGGLRLKLQPQGLMQRGSVCLCVGPRHMIQFQVKAVYPENRCAVGRAMNQTSNIGCAVHSCVFVTNRNGFIQPSISLQALFFHYN